MARFPNLELKEAIFSVCGQMERRPSSKEVLVQLELIGYSGVRSDRQIRRYLAEWDEADRRGEAADYRLARWPESFGPGLLPWEAAPSVLEYIRHSSRRPTLAAARWYWHISIAAPSLPIRTRMRATVVMLNAEIAANRDTLKRAVESHLMGVKSAPELGQLHFELPKELGRALEKRLEEAMQSYSPETTLAEIEEEEGGRDDTKD